MVAQYASNDWLDEEPEVSDEAAIEKQIVLDRIAELHRLTNFPPFNYVYGNDKKLIEIRSDFVDSLLEINKALNKADKVGPGFLEKFLKGVTTEIAEAEMYKSRYATIQKATEAYVKDNKTDQMSIDDFEI